MSKILQSLLQFLDEDPNDAFTLYAIALEYQKSDLQKSEFYYQKLLNKHPKYISTYYQYASMLQSINNINEAEKIYKLGIEIATEIRDFHALAELKQALNKLLGLDYEDE